MSVFLVNIGKERINRAGQPGYFYIGRGSVLGNPFRIGEDGTRDQVIDRYREWLYVRLTRSEFMSDLNEMVRVLEQGQPLILGCFCAPLRCHGDIIREYLDFRINGIPPAA